MLLLHLLTCWLAWFGFRQQTPSYLFAGLAVLALNGVSYALIRRSGPGPVRKPHLVSYFFIHSVDNLWIKPGADPPL